MKIVIASGTVFPEVSGQSTFVHHFTEQLQSHAVKYAVISYGDHISSQQNWIRIKRNWSRHVRYFFALKRILTAGDVIYAQDLFSSGFPAAFAKGKRNALVIRLGGDFLWEKMVEAGTCDVPLSDYYHQRKSLIEKWYVMIYRYVLRKADHIIFNTEWQKEMYQKVFGLDREKTSVINNPFYIKTQDSKSANDESDNTIIFAGRFSGLKNLERLIAAFKKVDTDASLELIGDGPRRATLIQQAVGDKRIKILPKLCHKDLSAKLQRCLFVVLPSLTEVSPNLVSEAIGLKKPVVITSDNGLPNAIKECVISVDPLDEKSIAAGISYLLTDQNRRQVIEKMSKINLVHDWNEIYNQHLEIFKQLDIRI